jgi:hypothetical protein
VFFAGDHVPATPFNEVVGKVNVPPEQIAETCVNVGTTNGVLEITQVHELAFHVAVSLHVVVGCAGCVPVTSQEHVVALKFAVS